MAPLKIQGCRRIADLSRPAFNVINFIKKNLEWRASVYTRTGKQKTGCPYCINKKILRGYNDLASVYPKLLKEWDFEKNIDISPYSIAPMSNKYVWWKCEKGHSWRTSINARNGGGEWLSLLQ